jgi:hypothetical protein
MMSRGYGVHFGAGVRRVEEVSYDGVSALCRRKYREPLRAFTLADHYRTIRRAHPIIF